MLYTILIQSLVSSYNSLHADYYVTVMYISTGVAAKSMKSKKHAYVNVYLNAVLFGV